MPGIAGARAAGMTVLGFHGGSHCRPGHGETLRAAGAVMTFDDMRQLPDLIGRIEASAVAKLTVALASFRDGAKHQTRNCQRNSGFACWRIAPE